MQPWLFLEFRWSLGWGGPKQLHIGAVAMKGLFKS